MAQQSITMFQNDTSPNLTFDVIRTDGSIVNLTGCTVNFRIQDPATGQRTNDDSSLCTVSNALAGECQYAWTPTDLPDSGIYNANLQITFPTLDGTAMANQIETAAITINTMNII